MRFEFSSANGNLLILPGDQKDKIDVRPLSRNGWSFGQLVLSIFRRLMNVAKTDKGEKIRTDALNKKNV